MPTDVLAVSRQRWDAAMAELSNLVLAAPELYETAMTLVRQTADVLRPECTSPASLLTTVDRAGAVAAAAAGKAGPPAVGLRPDVIAAASLALLLREVTERQARLERLSRLAAARDEGLAWTVVEEAGDPQDEASVYRRVDVHVATGAALIASAGPDETFSGRVYWLLRARLDLATGGLGPDPDGGAVEEYPDQAVWQAAQVRAHGGPATPRQP